MNSWFSTVQQLRPSSLGLLVACLALAACGRSDVQVYRVAKEQPDQAAQPNPAAMPPGHPDIGSGAGAGAAAPMPGLKYTVPSGWEEQPAGQMRVASFRVKGDAGKQADVSVVPLPGMAGGDFANVNRWRGQVGLAPVSEDELAKLGEQVEVAGQKGQLYDQAGQAPGSDEKSRILAVVMHQNDVAWFFKMTGDDGLVAQQKPAFISFLKSVTFTAPAESAALPASHPPMDAGLLSAAPGQGDAAAEVKPAWQVPAGWQETAGGPFLIAKFTLPGSAAVNVSRSAGEGGGVAGNVNRWRGQLGLGQLSEEEINKAVTPVDTSGGKAMFVDMSGTDARTGQKSRLVGAIVPQGNQTWFYKLMGEEQVVGREKDAFTKFVQTTKYP